MENIIDVANYIMATKGMTKAKVQIIMYFAYSTYLAKNNEEYSDNMNKLFEGEFEAWRNIGPIDRTVYDYMNKLSDLEKSNLNKNEIKFQDIKNKIFLDQIIKEYRKYSAQELKKMAKRGDPWYYACVYPRLCGIIPSCEMKDKYIYEYFRKLI